MLSDEYSSKKKHLQVIDAVLSDTDRDIAFNEDQSNKIQKSKGEKKSKNLKVVNERVEAIKAGMTWTFLNRKR